MRNSLVAGVGFAVLAGCATTGPVGPERIQATETAIQEADTAGASKLPEATTYLQLARQELDQGKKLSSDGYGHRAELALDRANEDAKLAKILADKQRMDNEIKDANERLKAMQ